MTLDELLRAAAERGITLSADGGQLRVRAARGALTPAIREALARHKPELITLVAGLTQRLDEGGPIARRAGQGPAPLSFAQQRLWLLEQVEGASAVYHVPACVWLDGPVDLDRLRDALLRCVERHEALRTAIVSTAGEAAQQVRAARLPFDVVDLSAAPDPDAAALNGATAFVRQPFNLEAGDVMRARVFRVHGTRHLIAISCHHIAADAWSMGVLLQDLRALYAGDSLPDLPLQYADFAAWQHEHLGGPRRDRLLQYWREALAGSPAVIELPTDRPRPAVQSFQGRIERFTIPAALAGRVRAFGQARGATLFQTLLSAFQALLRRYSRQDTIVVGTPVANRTRPELEPLVGFFVNTLVFRADFETQTTFAGLLDRVAASTTDGYAHQDLPFELLVSELAPARSLSHNPIFQVMFALQNAPMGAMRLGDGTLTHQPVDLGVSKFDLYLSLEERADGSLSGEWEYATDLFDRSTITRMIEHYQVLIGACVESPDVPVSTLTLMTEAEERLVTRTWNDTALPWREDASLVHLLLEQAARTPDAIAVTDANGAFTYRELDGRSADVARALVAAGVRPETRVGLRLQRGADAIAAMLGILRAGGAYVAIDPAYPEDRQRFIAEDAGLDTIITDAWMATLRPASATLPPLPAPSQLAYLIYTSGSTGRPKGILIEHRNAVSLICWAQTVFTRDVLAGTLASTSFCFDLSIFEIFLPLSVGGTVIVADNALAIDAHPWRDRITLINTVPSAMAELVRGGGVPPSVRVVNLAGEPLKPTLVDGIYALGHVRDVYDLYGPGETTTYSTFVRRERGGRESIGRPIGNTRLYLLDEHRRPVPVGVPGEIYIAGPGVTRGYLARSELTADRYVELGSGLSSADAGENDAAAAGRLYRSGDLGRFWPDGEVQYLGRIDHQVKVRGFRVELGEVEHAIAACADTGDVVVHAPEDDRGARVLAAYYTGAADPGAVRAELQSRLPAFMVPSAFVRLPALPRTPNGKIDRKALPPPQQGDRSAPFTAPATDTERTLAAIWAGVLRRDRVGTHENFFEIGGDSILAMQVVARAREAGLSIAPSLLFQHQTVAALAPACVSTPADAAVKDDPGAVPLTPPQRWCLETPTGAPQHFNQWIELRVPAAIDAARLRAACETLASRHSALRLRFTRGPEGWQQRLTFALDGIAVEEVPGAEFQRAQARAQQSLDLEHGPLARCVLGPPDDSSRALFLTCHHLVIDGVSWRVICADLAALCADPSSGTSSRWPPVPASFVAWARTIAPGRAMTSPPGTHGRYGDRAIVAADLPPDDTSALLFGAPLLHQPSLHEVLERTLREALSAWAPTRALTIDVEAHGRDASGAVDVSGAVGWFTSFHGAGDVSLNYLGQIDAGMPDGWTLKAAGLSAGADRPRSHGLAIAAFVREGRLHWEIEFARDRHDPSHVQSLSARWRERLTAAAAGCALPFLAVPPLAGNVESILPATPAQEGMLLHSMLARGGDIYTTTLQVELAGSLDETRFRQAWRQTAARHGALRTCFARDASQNILQVTLRKVGDEPLALWADDPSGPVTSRVAIERTGQAAWRFTWTSHHALLDGWSLAVVLRDLADAYAGRSAPARLTYREAMRAALPKEAAGSDDFWRTELDGWSEPLDLPFLRAGASSPSRRASHLVLSTGETDSLTRWARSHRLTLHTVLQGAWAAVLARHADRGDVVMGGVVSGRATAGTAGLDGAAGLFIQTVPVRVRLDDGESIAAWMQGLQARHAEREQHAHVPLVRLQELSAFPRGTALFDTLLVLENYPIDEALRDRLGDVAVTAVTVEEHPHYPLTIVVSGDTALTIAATYDPARVDAAAVEPLLRRFAHVLATIAEDRAAKVGDLSAVTPDEEQRLLVEWNDTHRAYDTTVTLVDLFERQVDRTPRAPAVVFEGETLTYAQLDAAANRLGHTLIARGVGPGTLVGVCMERSIELVVALYGVLKAGGAYVPIDPDYPAARRDFMARDAQVGIVLDRDAVRDAGGADTRPARQAGPTDVAYMIYTSGSTGQPKGALNAHAGIVNRLLWMQDAFALGADDRVLQKTPFSFDVSVWEFFWPLLTGAAIVVARPRGHLDAAYLADTITRSGITTVHFVPSMLQVFLDSPAAARCTSLRRVIVSGEALTPALVRACHATLGAELHNLYGPTEAAVDVTWWPCPRETAIDRVPIGRPIANTQMYVLDRRGRLTPPGVPGELCIGGVQVGLGYWNRAELTAERFVPDPFAGAPGARLYRTGDRAAFLPDGAIEYLGRLDHQVKIRGVRIELGEIESAIAEDESVRDALVTVRGQGADAELVAYVVGRGGATPDAKSLRDRLRQRLPEVMVPSVVVPLEAMPLLPNGKVNRAALPDPSRVETRRSAPGALSEAERAIAEAWAAVLGHREFGASDNFFDVGGQSLKMMRVHARLQQAFRSDLPLLALFEHPTIEDLARHLTGTSLAPMSHAAPARADRTAGGPVDVAVIGMSCRVPGAGDVEAFWTNLLDGVDSVTRFSEAELLAAGEDPAQVHDPQYVNAYGAIDHPDWFDAAFFDVPASEAEILDPQQRVFLECAWAAFEHAGYDPRRVKVPVGVYAGAGLNTYAIRHLQTRPDVLAERGAYPLLIVSDKDYLPTRVSYKLNLTGPSMSVQTACSTSLVAIATACEALARGDCDMALAGGVSVRFPQAAGYVYQEGMIFSADGRTRAFDAAATGMVPASGAGAVILKRLDDALADGDHVHAVIKGCAVNNDGAAKVGYTAPSVDGQSRVIGAALERAGVPARSIGYVEAHGTATPMGDPIEVAALTRAWSAHTTDRQFCALGSVKTNVGHLDAAAGVTGFIKAVLAVERGVIPASLYYETPNPALNLAESPFFVPAAGLEWTSGDPRRAAVSSFGIGGTNAHVILEQAPPTRARSVAPRAPHALVAVSANSEAALDLCCGRLADALEGSPSFSLHDVSFTLLEGRPRLPFRRTVTATRVRDAAVRLREGASGARGRGPGTRVERVDARGRDVVFVFPGYGAQYPGMARGLYEQEPRFRDVIDRGADVLKAHCGLDVRPLMFGDDRAALRHASLAHPATFLVSCAVVELWRAAGVVPSAVMGNSLGEITAAYVAGVFEFDAAVTLVYERARLMEEAAPGGMLAVPLGERDVARYLTGSLGVAVHVSPENTVVAGTGSDIDTLEAALTAEGVDVRRVEGNLATHSPRMGAASPGLERCVAATARSEPRLPLLSNVTGTWMSPTQAMSPSYWAEHVRVPVRLSACVQELLARHPHACVVEAGPGRSLANAVRANAIGGARVIQTSIRHHSDEVDDREFFLQAAGRLWEAGVTLDARGLCGPDARRVVLPSYPFERKRYAIEPGGAANMGRPGETRAPNIAEWVSLPTWERSSPPAPAPAGVDRVLLFADALGVAREVTARLAAGGVEVIEARPHDREGYDALIQRLRGASAPAILHLWSVGHADADAALEHGFHSLLLLGQALGDEALPNLRVVIASTHAHSVLGSEPIVAARAALAGPARVIPQELPGISTVHVDFAAGELAAGAAADALLAELARNTEPVVAYRNGRRWTRRFAALSDGDLIGTPRLREGGTYFITGGLGAVGLELAASIAEATSGVHLALAGRHVDDTRRVAAEARLAPFGARVTCIASDVADRTSLERVLAKLGAVHGIVHAAGLPGGGSMNLRTRESIDAEFAAKITGTSNLIDWSRGRELDFMALCSSTSAFTGGFGSVAYTAANACMDALAEQACAGGLPVLTIDWHRWKGLGMAAEVERLHEKLTGESLTDGITAAEGRAIFRRLLGRLDLRQVAVCPVDLNAVERATRTLEARLPGRAPAATPATGLADALEGATDTERALAAIWQDVLGVEMLSLHDTFTSLGGDSLLALRVISRVRTSLGVALPVRALYERPTIAELARHASTLQWAADSRGAGNRAAEGHETGVI